ncbi:MAG: hypothetical protein A2381_16760 [Bdellovibrionales bacterium RIFOXYB1_FULL_37_110]|nr:MAG: hypothetical protein A2181_07765 [Bdellovibrionales bacterium RIFOXYA1_FULL_38_20]OFZ50049.1 MAG: hypothetical protein A2417_18595 [Bdellovibrionales bacterium RIFOXYC1_FULL_37_79]OFZ59955.1 MAG: hypothetical protein A2381_16760 [Bdellovibrionales bacterium RIFOXYB1_FULL_37_110]OFZ63926.1 MAG: hypothetical protein A2577_05950 [Bdellovibrionales bacterium RIFOXYD1_FULL_36_51]
MSRKNNDDKLRMTIEKHQFHQDIAKTLDSTGNRKIQQIFDKSMTDEDTKQTSVTLGEKKRQGNVKAEHKEIVVNLPGNSNQDVDQTLPGKEISLPPLDLDNEDWSDENALEELQFGNSQSFKSETGDFSMDDQEEKNENVEEDLDFNIDFNENQGEEEENGKEKGSLFDALKNSQAVENEFVEEVESDDTSLDEVFENIEDDELSPTMVDLNKKNILEKMHNENEDLTQGGFSIESDIIEQKGPSFNAMPEGFETDDEQNPSQRMKDDESNKGMVMDDLKDFGLDDENDDSNDQEEMTKVDHMNMVQEEKRLPAFPKSTLKKSEDDFDDMSVTQVVSQSEQAHEEFDDEIDEDTMLDESFSELSVSNETTKLLKPQGQSNEKTDDAENEPSLTYDETKMLKHQTTIRILREDRQSLLDEIEDLKTKNQRIQKENIGLKAELDELQIELSIIKKRHEDDIRELRYNLNYSEDRKKIMEEKLKKNQEELGLVGERVRLDLEKLRRKEKELENQLELVQMDTANQVQNRENKILDLKRKIDALEFNMENTILKEQKTREDKKKLEERLRSIMKTLRGSIRLLEEDIGPDDDLFKGLDNL